MKAVIGAECADFLLSCSEDQEQEALRRAYRAMMTAPDASVSKCLNDIINRVKTAG